MTYACSSLLIAHINTEEVSNCVSREEFDSLQKELNYWQNTTISILKKYLIDNEGKLDASTTKMIAETEFKI